MNKSQCWHIGPLESPSLSPEMLFLKITGFVNYSEIASRLQCVWLVGNYKQEGNKLEKTGTWLYEAKNALFQAACPFSCNSCSTALLWRTWANAGEWCPSPVLSFHTAVSPGSHRTFLFRYWVEKNQLHHFTFVIFVWFFWVKQQKRGETFYSTRLRKAGVTPEKPVPGIEVVPFPRGTGCVPAQCHRGRTGVVQAVTPRLGWGCALSVCALLHLRKCWQVNLASHAWPGICSLGIHQIPCVHVLGWSVLGWSVQGWQ